MDYLLLVIRSDGEVLEYPCATDHEIQSYMSGFLRDSVINRERTIDFKIINRTIA